MVAMLLIFILIWIRFAILDLVGRWQTINCLTKHKWFLQLPMRRTISEKMFGLPDFQIYMFIGFLYYLYTRPYVYNWMSQKVSELFLDGS